MVVGPDQESMDKADSAHEEYVKYVPEYVRHNMKAAKAGKESAWKYSRVKLRSATEDFKELAGPTSLITQWGESVQPVPNNSSAQPPSYTRGNASTVKSEPEGISRPPIFCNIFLLVYVPLGLLGVLVVIFGMKRAQAAEAVPRAMVPAGRQAGARGSILVVDDSDSVQQKGLQQSSMGQAVYIASIGYLLLTHALLILLSAAATGLAYKSEFLMSLGGIFLATPGSAPPTYQWDALGLAFIFTFLPCLVLTLLHAIGSVSWRLRFLLPCAMSDAELVSVTRDVGNDGSQMSAQEWVVNRAIHSFITGVLASCGANRDKIIEIANVQRTEGEQRYIVLRGVQYAFDEQEGQFTAMQAAPKRRIGDLRRRIDSGLDETEIRERTILFGLNKMDVPVPTLCGAIWQEVTGYGYLYQLFFLYQWFFLVVTKIATVWTVVFFFSAFTKAWIMRNNMLTLRQVAQAAADKSFKVIRRGTDTTVRSQELLPGDIVVFYESGAEVPADCFLLQGNLLVDESVVTGEATPVQKFPLSDDENKVVRAREDKKNYIFAGSSILQGDPTCKAVVVDTGVNTSRGQLLNMSLYPNPLWIKFDEDYKVLFVYSFVFGIVAGIFVMRMMDWTVPAVFQAGFAIWNTFSPLLPVALVMGQSKAANRLREHHGILCLTPARAAVAGRVDIALFDKTGTLTEDGLEMVGAVLEGGEEIQETRQLFDPADWSQLGANPRAQGIRLVMGMAHNVACHGSNFVGSQVEIGMLQKSSATPESSEGQVCTVSWSDGMRVEAVEKYPFNHNSMTMSVVVKCHTPVTIGGERQEGRRFALVKGAPEKVAELCGQSMNTQDPEADPSSAGAKEMFGLQRLLKANNTFSKQGCYILMAAFKRLPDEGSDVPSRDAIEQIGSLQPLGLLIFRNPLRLESPQLIPELKSGATDSVMVSGDSHLTAAAIAREAGILSATKVLVADVDSHQVTWLDMDSGAPGDPMADDAQLVVSAAAWASFAGDTPWLSKAKVFGRTSPEQKVEIVEAFIRCGHTTMFVGDGGNDCGALRAAHVGIALTQQKVQEGSQSGSVIAHFNTTEKTPTAALQVLQEGRCALAGSLSTFRFLFGYGLQITALKYFMFGTDHKFHWTGQSLMVLEGIFLPIIIPAMVGSRPRDDLDQKRPSWSLINNEGLLGMIGPLFISMCLVWLSFFYMTGQDWYTPWDRETAGAEAHNYVSWGDNFEMEVIFLVWFAILAAQSASFTLGGRFREPVWNNLLLMGIVVTVYFMVLSLTWTQRNAWTCGMRINCDQEALDVINKKTSYLQWLEMYPGEATHWMSNIPGGNVMPTVLALVITACAVGALFIFLGFQKVVMEKVQEMED